MADTSKCFSLIRGRTMRVTKVDACGVPVLGPDSVVVSDGFISVALTANTDEGTTISVTNAAGRICILDEPCPAFLNYGVEVAFCGVDPELYRLMTGQKMVTDFSTPTPLGVGFRVNSGVDVCGTGFALELWSNVPAASCQAGQAAYGYFLVPFIKGGVIGDFTVQNDAVNFTLSGANSKDGSGWGVGPNNVVTNATGVAVPLKDAIDTKDHLHMQLTTVAPPADPGCATVALGVPATGATAGSPATLTPANSYAPANLAGAATGFTATPATAWTAGQYVTFRDGSTGHWSSSAWVAGPA